MSSSFDPRPLKRGYWGIAWLFFTLCCLFAYYYLTPTFLDGERIASLKSPWKGPVALSNGRLHITGSQPLTVVALPVGLVPHQRYQVEIAVSSDVSVHVDFMAPGYDSPTEERVLPLPLVQTDTHRFYFNSQACPPNASVRIFFQGEAEVTLAHFSVTRVTLGYEIFRALLVIVPILLLGVLVWTGLSRDLATAVTLGAVVLAVYSALPHNAIPNGQLGDNQWYLPSAESLVRDGDLDLSDRPASLQEQHHYGLRDYQDGKMISIFPVGMSILLGPPLVVAHLLHVSDRNAGLFLTHLLASGSVFFLFCCLRRLGLRWEFALLVSLVFAFASSHLSLHAGGLWSHNASLFLSLVFLCFLFDPRPFVRLLAAPVAALGYISRPDFSILILAAFAYLFLEQRKLLLPFALLAALSIAPFLVWSLGTFGSLLPPYYRAERLEIGWQVVIVFYGQLLSPNRGLFIFNPFLLLSVAGALCSFAVRGAHRRLYQIFSIVCLLHTFAISSFPHWWAGWSFGPRFFAPILGVLFILTVPFFEWLAQQAQVLKTGAMIFMVATAGWGGFVHFRGATAESVNAWNAFPNVDEHPDRIWSWRDMEIFN